MRPLGGHSFCKCCQSPTIKKTNARVWRVQARRDGKEEALLEEVGEAYCWPCRGTGTQDCGCCPCKVCK